MNTHTLERDTATLTAPALPLGAAIITAAAVVSKDKTLPLLNLIKLLTTERGLEIVATDRFRLTSATVLGVGGEFDAVTDPAPLIKWFKGLKPKAGESVELLPLGDTLTLTAPGRDYPALTVSLGDDHYPKYQSLKLSPENFTDKGVNLSNYDPALMAGLLTAYAKVCDTVSVKYPAEANRAVSITPAAGLIEGLELWSALMPKRVI
jgi:hypothetical protein